ncbi:MAG: glycosyltransferase [Lachnospiraceae bacterium]|nr:glycosyltransferase [Lachnospiraceae bacterium]
MNILLYDFISYTQKDLAYFLKKAGHHCKNILYKIKDDYKDDFFEYRLGQYLSDGNFDCVISINFHPLVAKICYQYQVKYLSWSYDSPISKMHMEYYQYPTNYIFLFDRMEAQYFQSQGMEHVFHMPLAVNLERLASASLSISPLEKEAYSSDISFVGKFYDSSLKEILTLAQDYDRGFIQAIVDAQLQVYGYNFVEDSIKPELPKRITDNFINAGIKIYCGGFEELSKGALVHSINKEITRRERIMLLNLLNRYYDVNYYSYECPQLLKDVIYCGTVNYLSDMPKVFRLSKINLNITLKSIQSGIPLRALDIMGSGGFLLSNYQPELAEYFIPDRDIVLYESIPDALSKADFYLRHEDARHSVINHAFDVLNTHFTYPMRIKEMFQTAGL